MPSHPSPAECGRRREEGAPRHVGSSGERSDLKKRHVMAAALRKTGIQPEAANEELRNEARERSRAEAELQSLKDELSADLAAMIHLREFSMRLLASTALQPILEEVLSAIIDLQGADFGNVQLYNPESQALEIVALIEGERGQWIPIG